MMKTGKSYSRTAQYTLISRLGKKPHNKRQYRGLEKSGPFSLAGLRRYRSPPANSPKIPQISQQQNFPLCRCCGHIHFSENYSAVSVCWYGNDQHRPELPGCRILSQSGFASNAVAHAPPSWYHRHAYSDDFGQ
ncbi:hypothetical protein [Enterobacter mori]|uniref:hypothetical protein n=1 Tax=Enterobacter mori TaxID=539813 RepID=UPI003B843F5E